jgi:hypothetical protein
MGENSKIEWCHALRVGAKSTGRLLDDVLHDEYPKTINIRRTPDQYPTHHEHEAQPC